MSEVEQARCDWLCEQLLDAYRRIAAFERTFPYLVQATCSEGPNAVSVRERAREKLYDYMETRREGRDDA